MMITLGSNYKITNVSRDKNGRVLIIDVIGDKEFTTCNIYAPNDDDPNFLIQTLAMLDNHVHPHKIITGDLNLCFNLDLEKKWTMYNNVKAVEILNYYIHENMTDIWRTRNTDKFAFTWKRTSPSLIMSCLDYFIGSTGASGWIDNVYIKPGFKSDHFLIGIELYPSEIV